MLRRNYARSTNVSIERRGKKKLHGNYQKFDPSSIFYDVEEAPGNFLGQVTQSGQEPRIRLISHALGNRMNEFTIQFRKDLNSDTPKEAPSYFKPGAMNTPKKVTYPGEKMSVGDIVEMQACHIKNGGSILCPWSFDLVAKKDTANNHIMMPEMPSCLISKAKPDEPGKRDYQIVSAARGEAKTITSFLDNLSMLKSYLGYQTPMVNGFILRGPLKPGHKVWHGMTCLKTLNDIEEERSNEEVIFNFLKAKGHHVVDHISEDSPWQVVPLYVGRPTLSVRDRLDQSFQQKHYMSFGVMAATELKFVNCNIVLTPTMTGAPVIKHFNICRSKPLQMDASIPDRAIEKKIKEMTENLVPA